MGELAALGAAFVWALSSIIWQRVGQEIPAVVLNLLKGAIALVMLLATILILGKSLPAINPNILAMLLVSGALGIGLGDTAWFVVLKYLGARRALLLETLSPPLTALFSWIFLQEKLSVIAYLGILLTICGVAWVIAERTAETALPSKHIWLGLGISLLGQTSHAVGAVLSRAAFERGNGGNAVFFKPHKYCKFATIKSTQNISSYCNSSFFGNLSRHFPATDFIKIRTGRNCSGAEFYQSSVCATFSRAGGRKGESPGGCGSARGDRRNYTIIGF
jgi:uncharacterized membrane protein